MRSFVGFIPRQQKTNAPFGINLIILIAAALPFAPSLYAQPNAPSNLTATAASGSQINLAWQDNSSNEDGFIIQRSAVSGSGFADIDTIPANVTNFSDTGLNENTAYYYKVVAYEDTTGTSSSNEANATTLPATPGGLNATTVSNSRIDLAWTDNSGVEDGFKIELKTGAAGSYAEIATVGANVTSYSSTGLVPSTVYYFRVRAYKGGSHSAYSEEDSATTHPDPPSAPGSLTATAASNTQINLAWNDNSSNEEGFKIERKLTGGATFTQIDVVGAGVTSYASTGLSASTGYTYRVRAYNAGGHSAYSNQASATTLIDPPAAPSGLSASTVSNTRIDLAWSDNATTETGYKIERKTEGDSAFTEIATTGANVTSYENTGLSGSTQYFYRVRAYNAGGHSAYSNEDDATTLQDPPAAPGDLSATTVSNERIDLAWTDNSDNEDGFKIELRAGAEGDFTEIATTAANVTAYQSTGLEAGTEYFYRVRAFNSTGNSSYSNEDSASTLPEPPEAPSGLNAAAASQTQINLSWTDNSSTESGFKIERKLATAATFAEIDSVGAGVTNYASTGLAANTAYSYRVRAYNAAGHSAYTNEAGATTLPNPPDAPSDLNASTLGTSQIELAWTDNAATETGFKIERKTGAGAYTQIDSVGANTTNYNDHGLSSGTLYFYRVRAYNTGGNSAYSNVDSAATLPDLPAAPSDLAATTASNTQINLSWTDNASTEDGFKIERKTGAGGVYAEIDSVGANVTVYASTGLSGDTEYFYRVHAYNLSGVSESSNEASATTHPDLPAAPSALTASAASPFQINLAWTDNSSNEAGFKIEMKSAADSAFAEIDSTGANTTAYAATGLLPNTQYFFRVRAFNITGYSAYADTANATTQPDPPATPTGLAALAVSNSQINLSWTDNSSNEDGFKIERKITAAPTFSQIAAVGANVTSFSDSGLAAGTSYSYRVRAYNASGHSSFTSIARDTTFVNPPAAPTALTATAVSTNQINLAWTDNSGNEDGFRVERQLPGDTVFTQIAALGANVTSYANTGLDASTAYFYRVRAHRMNNSFSNYSNVAGDTTLAPVPAAPDSLTATAVSSSQINLAWQDHAGDEDGFKIERKQGAGGTYAEVAAVGPNVTSYSNTAGLSANAKYFYRVRAYNGNGHSGYSNEAGATTLLKAPTSLSAVAVSGSQINLTWLDQTNSETGFKIESKTGAAGAYVEIATVGANVTSYSNTGLAGSTVYFYRVRAYNASNVSAYSNEAGDTTFAAPAAPDSLTATAVSNTQINLAWQDESSNEEGFRIERKQGAAGTYSEIATVAANTTSYVNSSGLVANVKYFYRIRAYNANGNSAYANEASATTLLKAPAGLAAAAVSSSQINLTWTDQTNNESGFKIERKTGAAGTFAEIAAVAANVTNYSNTGLASNTLYFYRVRAYNASNVSAYSNEAGDTTFAAPAAPDSLTATAVSNLQINLAWQDKSSNESGFKIERKQNAGGTYAEIATVGPNVTSYVNNSGLTGNTKYFYRVRAYNAVGNSDYGNEAGATTLLKTPTSLTATAAGSSQINLSWIDQTANESGFKIERKTGAAGAYAEIATVSANVTSYSNTGLAANTQYFYRVRAYNATNVSAYSNEDDATTSAPAKALTPDSVAAALPEGLVLAPNYPNPFNPATTIAYSLSEGMHVRLTVVNVNGQIVAVLANGYHAAGRYQRVFKAKDLPSGVYYAVLKAGAATRTQRMLLTK